MSGADVRQRHALPRWWDAQTRQPGPSTRLDSRSGPLFQTDAVLGCSAVGGCLRSACCSACCCPAAAPAPSPSFRLGTTSRRFPQIVSAASHAQKKARGEAAAQTPCPNDQRLHVFHYHCLRPHARPAHCGSDRCLCRPTPHRGIAPVLPSIPGQPASLLHRLCSALSVLCSAAPLLPLPCLALASFPVVITSPIRSPRRGVVHPPSFGLTPSSRALAGPTVSPSRRSRSRSVQA